MSKAIEKYLAVIREVTRQPGTYAYRGQENSNWPLHSGATRRLVSATGTEVIRDRDFHQLYLSYHRDSLLEPARTQGFGLEEGNTVSDLQLLAKLQHLGAATGLLDFTWNPLVALWFASQNDRCDGKLYIVNTNNPIHLARISSDEEEQTIESIFLPVDTLPAMSYWEPRLSGDAMLRILRQRSVFIIGRPLVQMDPDLVIEVEVSKVDKAALRTDLELLDTSYTSLFQDVHGFSQSQGTSFPLRQLKTPQWFLIQGNHSFQEGNYSDAIRAYSECVKLAPEVSELYFQRANARSACGEFPEAIQDYTHAINHKRFPFLGNALAKVSSVRHPFLHLIHFNRGNARAELSDIEGASSDYSESIRLEPSLMREGYFNRGNIHLDSMRLSEAIEDYDHAIAQGHKGALFNKGNPLVMLGRFDEAIECYKLLEQQGAHMASHIVNRIALEDVTDRIRDNHYKVQFKKEEESGYPNLAQLVVHIDGYGYEPEIINGHKYIWNRLFKGRVGNTGGFGWKGLPPGKGSEGKEGFILTIEPMAREVKEE